MEMKKKERCCSFPYRSGENPLCECSYCFDKQCKNMVTKKKCFHMCAVLDGNEEKCCRCLETELCILCKFLETNLRMRRVLHRNADISMEHTPKMRDDWRV